ncbi:uncharacterized protein [Arachis hypogaea]|uniref:uncharacterized protein n=1 Tax=Arachis hypogaea TaxID=3818 RepID=UPI000DEC3BB8|nr:uncharacterized protein LOC112779089 [Arachis hypogaea]
MRILWNGEVLEEFTPSKGIREGDPLSPYIFVLCIERLSQLISAACDHQFWKPIKLNKDGPALSHLCFADDLILFAEADVQQAKIINKVLEEFCKSSGKKVNNEKTRIFFSNNVGHTIREEISNSLNFSRTDDLGKYLGVPILHSKVSKDTYKNVINKMNSRLNNWKASALSLAGRTTLVKSILSSLPSYTIQTAILPTNTCNLIDRKCINFLWGDTEQTKKVHILSWDKINKPKVSGGLGLRHAKDVNHSFMMKLGWGLIANKDSLWARVLRSKYKCRSDILPRVNRKSSMSNLWKEIVSAWHDIERNSIWRIGDGSQIKFWEHNWVPNLGSLQQHTTQVISLGDLESSLMNFLNVSGDWDEDKLKEWLPESTVKRIMAMAPPSPWKKADCIAWANTYDGCFSLKSAYKSITEVQSPLDRVFKLIWNRKGPEREIRASNSVEPPPKHYLKLNVDGSLYAHNSNAACEGLQIANTNGFQKIVVESDSWSAINFIKEGCSSAHPCNTLIDDIRILARRLQSVIWNHTLREGNMVADLLAKKGQKLPVGLHIFDVPLPDLSYVLFLDCSGVPRVKIVENCFEYTLKIGLLSGYATDGTVEKCTDTDNVTCVSLQLKDWDVKV